MAWRRTSDGDGNHPRLKSEFRVHVSLARPASRECPPPKLLRREDLSYSPSDAAEKLTCATDLPIFGENEFPKTTLLPGIFSRPLGLHPQGERFMSDKDEILFDHNNDGIDRRGFLKCMACAG